MGSPSHAARPRLAGASWLGRGRSPWRPRRSALTFGTLAAVSDFAAAVALRFEAPCVVMVVLAAAATALTRTLA